ncbi:hypothetical protein J4Q44_G00070460, partial [Coregonus suidteri]
SPRYHPEGEVKTRCRPGVCDSTEHPPGGAVACREDQTFLSGGREENKKQPKDHATCCHGGGRRHPRGISARGITLHLFSHL